MRNSTGSKLGLASVLLATVTIIAAVVCYSQLLDKPLLGPHAFRQTQNAISSYYFARDGFPIWVNYMPVLGPPWNLPTEFPFYQYVSALSHRASGFSLDVSGRIVSILFMLLMLVPLGVVAVRLTGDHIAAWIAISLTASSPLYLFWAPSFMMETTAMFLVLTMVAALLAVSSSILQRGLHRTPVWNLLLIALALFSGTLGAMQKGTTWASAAGVVLLFSVYNCLTVTASKARVFASIAVLVVVFSVQLVSAKAWLYYGDQIKKENPIARDIIVVGSAHHNGWNYGTWDQKLAPETWHIIWSHFRDQIAVQLPLLGWFTTFFVILLGIICNPKVFWPIALLLAGFLSGPIIFTNLYMEHSYYWCANAIWFLLAVTVALVSISRRVVGRFSLASSALVVTALISLAGFFQWNTRFLPIIRQLPSQAALDESWSQVVQSILPEKRTLLVLGLDWNPLPFYYGERRGLGLPSAPWIPFGGEQFNSSLSLLSVEERLGAVLIANSLLSEQNMAALRLFFERTSISEQGQQTPFGVLFPAQDLVR